MPSTVFVKETHLFSKCDMQNSILGIIAIINKIYLFPQVSEKLKTPNTQ